MHFRLDFTAHISIHALREESDWAILNLRAMEHEFQSTLSVRRATYWIIGLPTNQAISIHALREESDFRGDVTP